jgi:catechol 2,3-dioxygenase-like lactoylglutathione lyase family enzyme
MALLSILETAVYAGDLDAAEAFYRDVLGLAVDSKLEGRHVFFHCGDSMLLVFDPDATAVPGGVVPTHGARGPGHIAFAIQADSFESWLDRLARHGIEVEALVDWPSGGRSIYVRDPSGNSVELTTPSIWGLVPE